MMESKIERHTELFELFWQKKHFFASHNVFSQENLQQQWASNDKSTINQTQYNTVAMLPGSIATALLMWKESGTQRSLTVGLDAVDGVFKLHVSNQVSINYSCLALLKQTNMKPVAVNNTIISKKVQKCAMHEKAVWQSAFFNFIVADPDLSQCNFLQQQPLQDCKKNLHGQLE